MFMSVSCNVCANARDEPMLLFSDLLLFLAIFLFLAYYAQCFAQSYLNYFILSMAIIAN